MSSAKRIAARFIALCCPLSFMAGALRAEAQGAPDGPINVLFIMSDQHNAHTLGASDNGFGGVSGSLTPNLDRLAAQGVRFTRAFCSAPQCAPSRYTMLTGRWPHFHGLRWNGVWEPRLYETFPSLAREAGYRTATIGKNHLAWLEQNQPLVEDHGFDLILDKDDYKQFCQDNGVPIHSAGGNYWSMPDVPGKINAAGYTYNTNEFHPSGYSADKVIEFIEQCAADESPFVCWYQMQDPHAPLLPSGPDDPHDWAHRYHPFDNLGLPPNLGKLATTVLFAFLQDQYIGTTDDEWRQFLSYYYGLITQVDFNIGRVLTRLDELGLADNTLVIYTADHGEMGSEMSAWTKWNIHYDAISRVPLIVRLPGVIPAGQVIDALVSNVDFFPTMVELTGVPISDARRTQVDGESLVDLMLAGQAPLGWRDEVFSELGVAGLSNHRGRTRMVRTQEAKYAYGEDDDEAELYDLLADPWEIDDVASVPGYATLLSEMQSRLAAWWDGESGHVPQYITNSVDEPPKAAFNPDPRTGDLDVPRDVDPSWVPSSAAPVQRVYLGTSPSAPQLFTELTHVESSFNPGTLAPGTTYYWRVDGVNDHGTGTGVLWSFTTALGGPAGPGLATTPGPEHRAEDVGLFPELAWTPAQDAASQVLYFGPEGAVQQVAVLPISATTFTPDRALVSGIFRLEADRTYHWRMDQTSAAGTTEGDVWIFTTSEAGLPGTATVIAPPHLDHNVVVSGGFVLAWMSGADATLHDVYFGPTFPLDYKGSQAGTTFDPGPLRAGATYYWRIDETTPYGTVVGWTWRFSVAP